MKHLRTLPTARLLGSLAGVIVLGAVVAAIAVAATTSSQAPPPQSLPTSVHQALAAPHDEGVTARIVFTNHLLPSGAFGAGVGSALLSGASGRLWAMPDGHGRLELQSDSGDVQITWSPSEFDAYDASSSTVYRAALPKWSARSGAADAPPTLEQVTAFLARVGSWAALSEAVPESVAGQAAYEVGAAPTRNGGLVGSVAVAWDAVHGVPLRVALTAKGSATPVLELRASEVSFGPIAMADVAVTPPAGTKVVDLDGSLTGGVDKAGNGDRSVVGLANVKAAADFPVSVPGTLGGRSLTDVRLVQGSRVVAVYGSGLDAIVVSEAKEGTARTLPAGASVLPTVTLPNGKAHELVMPLGTGLVWQSGGVSFLLLGSVTPTVAEGAVRELG